MESVKYDIISTKASSSFYSKYKTLSTPSANNNTNKASLSKIESYEIVFHNNHSNNPLNESKIKDLLHSQGIHFFNFKEQANILSGGNSKFQFKIRISGLNNNNSITNNTTNKTNKVGGITENTNIDDIEKVRDKLESNFGVKLVKNKEKANKRKKTEVTEECGPEVVTNHLISEENNLNSVNKKKDKIFGHNKKKSDLMKSNSKYKNIGLYNSKKEKELKEKNNEGVVKKKIRQKTPMNKKNK